MATIKSIAHDIVARIADEINTPHRDTATGMVSKTGDSANLLDANGDIQNMTGYTNQFKMNSESCSNTDITFEKNIITNRFNLETDDIVINGCKLNPQLYTMSSFIQQSNDCIQGYLDMVGTVLVRAWEPNLKKHVFIRRYIRTPILYPSMINEPIIDERFGLED